MQRRLPSLRSAALVAAGALAVHRLRYLAGYGADSGDALDRHGHGYLSLVLAGSVLALCLAGAGVARALVRASRSGEAGEPPPASFPVLWARASAALVVLYLVQESLEGLLAPGHLSGTAGVLGHGGWTAFGFAVAVGALVALLLCGAGAAVARVAGRRARARPPRLSARSRPPSLATWVRPSLLACHLLGRGPPLHSP